MKYIAQFKKVSLAAVAISILAGFLLIAFPEKCMQYIALVAGISLIVTGLAGMINYLKDRASGVTLVMGIFTVLAGILICVKYNEILRFIVALIGIFLLVAGLANLFTGLKIIAASGIFGWVTFALSILTVVFGIIAITKSQELTVSIVRFIGVTLFVYAALDIVSYFQVNKIVKNVENTVSRASDIETEGTIVE